MTVPLSSKMNLGAAPDKMAELERMNEEKSRKIRERDLEIVRLEERCSRLEDEVTKKKATDHRRDQQDDIEQHTETYIFCLDFNNHAQMKLIKEACLHLIRPIRYRYPDTRVGIIAQNPDAKIVHTISKVSEDIEKTVAQIGRSCGSRGDLSDTLHEAWSMVKKVSKVSDKACAIRIVLIGYNQSKGVLSKDILGWLQKAEVEVHNVIVGQQFAPRAEDIAWQLATETGGKNIFYS